MSQLSRRDIKLPMAAIFKNKRIYHAAGTYDRSMNLRHVRVRALCLALFLVLAECSSRFVDGPGAPPDDPLPDYRGIIADSLRPTTTKRPKLSINLPQIGSVEISGLRRVFNFTGWSWLACLKADGHGHPFYLAVFIKESVIVDSRSSVTIDKCDEQSYEPLDLRTPYPNVVHKETLQALH